MASILRSSKFVRYIAGFARNIVVNTPREFDGNFVNTTQCLCGAVPRSFATQASAQHEQNLDNYLKRLDQDVRRSGRISRRDIEDVLEEIRNTRTATSSQSLLVIRCCGNLVPEELPETRTKLVQEIWNTLKRLNVPMDISHYNALLRVYLENEYNFVPTEFLSNLESKGIEPNRVTYQRLIARYCQVGDIEGATKILEFMREKQLPVNENVFNALINGHSQAGDMDSARGILSVMSQAGLDPSADTYTTLMCGYACKGDVEAIESLIQECEAKEIYLLDKDFLDIIYALATNNFPEHIPAMLGKTRKAYGYSQDAINVILRLINKDLIEIAYSILKTIPRGVREDGVQMPLGAFFVRQMIKADLPVEKLISICEQLEKDELFERGLNLATETSLQLGNEKVSYALLNEMKARSLPIRQHYFWPLLVAKANEPDAIINVLLEMGKFGLHPNAETIREYVIPNIKGTGAEIIQRLREANISVGASASSLVYSLLLKYEIREASIIVQRVPAIYHPEMLKRALSNAFYKTNDAAAFARILRNIYETIDRREESDGEDFAKLDKTEVLGKYLLELTGLSRQFAVVAETVLREVVNQGLTISTTTAEILQEKLGEKLTPAISSLLEQLSSGDLIPVPVVKSEPMYTPYTKMSIPQLERLIANLESKNEKVIGLKRHLLMLYHRNKELDKMEALYGELEKEPDFKYTQGIYAQLLDVCAFHENYEKTMHYLNKLKECDPEFTLDESKTIRVITVMVKNNKLDEAIEFIKRPRDPKPDERNFTYNSLVWRLLNTLAEDGKVDDLQRLFDALLENNYLEVNNIILGPLVKVHLKNNDCDSALAKFEWCCNQFRATPWKNELACQLIQNEDAEKLQKLTDLSTSVHGEINSLYDLVFAFVECGRIRQARKILETPGLQNRPQRINYACQRYQQEGKVKPLEGLREATKDLNHIDRTDIYYQLLLSYIKQDDSDKSLALWTQMQEEDIPASQEFLVKLGTHLRSKNQEIPFNMPNITTSASITQLAKDDVHSQQQRKPKVVTAAPPPPKKELTVFRSLLRNGEVDAAMQLKAKSDETFTVTDNSLLIEKLVQANRVQDATKITLEMLEKGAAPLTRVFRYLLNKLANTGDIASITEIGNRLNSEAKKVVSFDNRICHANLVAGNAEGYLANLEKEIDEATEKDIPALGEKFPRGGAVGILERHPELLDRYEKLAFKYGDKGIVSPVNVLWSHYFITSNETKAEEVWRKYLEGAPRIMFQRVVQHARENNDEVLTAKLIEHLKTSQVTDGALGNAYSCLLDVLVTKGKQAEVVETFESALKSVAIDFINRTAVLRVKETYEALNKPFNHKIPPKNVKSQTSSSSSSEEESRHISK